MSKEDFYDLTPEDVMQAVENSGMQPTGEFQQLNSYENRVFDVRLEDKTRVIAKFYRPGRWSKETILDEHTFLNDLYKSGWPTVAPHKLGNGQTVDVERNIYYALWPKALGRMIDEWRAGDLMRVGRALAQLHNVGEQRKALQRPVFTTDFYGWDSLRVLADWVVPEVANRYFAAAEEILDYLEGVLDPASYIRIHGDCHRGNILRTDARGEEHSQLFFVDFDDFCMGPPVQDFWMLLSASESSEEGAADLEQLLAGYLEFRKFDESTLEWIPALRGLRMIHYAGWIARRWDDPTFPKLFPQFEDYNYWASETEALEKLRAGL
jgi:Ser/Thr protein kinase RdoA (MazF antagonist)